MSANSVRSYLSIALIMLLLWGIYQAVRIGMADIVAYKAEYLFASWEEDLRLPDQAEADAALASSASAISWEPGNPNYLNLHANILLYQGLLYWGRPAFSEVTANAIALYQRSAQLRPKWPYTWARLALVKSYRGEIDSVFNNAVDKAVKLGPWEPGVHNLLTEAGLYSWRQLDKTRQGFIVSNIHRGLHHNFQSVNAIVVRHKKRTLICAHLPMDKYSKKFCGW